MNKYPYIKACLQWAFFGLIGVFAFMLFITRPSAWFSDEWWLFTLAVMITYIVVCLPFATFLWGSVRK